MINSSYKQYDKIDPEKLVKQNWKVKLPKLIKTNKPFNSHEWPRENFSHNINPYDFK